MQRINEAISPYTRFVRAERGKMLDMQTRLEELRDQLTRLKADIQDL
jgi:hypothetical protein